MLRSMTACGRAQKSREGIELSIEIHSHNKRALDVNVKLPYELAFLDPFIRKALQAKVARGSLTLQLRALFSGNAPVDVTLNSALIEKIQRAAPFIALELLLPLVARDFPIVQVTPAVDQEEKLQSLVLEVLEEALEKFQAMKELEGSAIANEFERRLQILDAIVARIQKLCGGTEEKHRMKLGSRLAALFPDISHDERVAKEIAILAEKLDVSEELSRLKMHLISFRTTLKAVESEGKKLEFIVQELLREFNTIGSKAQDAEITEQVIVGKCEIEKIREQVMNVE